MANDVLGKYKILRKNLFKGYWEIRILVQLGYLLELLYYEEDQDPAVKALIDDAIMML